MVVVAKAKIELKKWRKIRKMCKNCEINGIYYGAEKDKPLRCFECKEEKDIFLRNLCSYTNCFAKAIYRIKSEKKQKKNKPLWCKKHSVGISDAEKVRSISKICIEPDCGTSLKWQHPLDKNIRGCSEHYLSGTKAKNNCPECDKLGVWGTKSWGPFPETEHSSIQKLRCGKHKLPTDVSLKSFAARCGVCFSQGIMKNKRYSKNGKYFCASHKPEIAVKSTTGMCKACGKISAAFAKKGTKNSIWCKTCAEASGEEYYNSKSKMCELCNEHQPCYGHIGGKPQWCNTCRHTLDFETIDVRSKKCEKCGKKQATYGLLGETAKWCSPCSPPDTVDVKSKMCHVCKPGKKLRANFGLVKGKPLTCLKHRGKGYENVTSKRCEKDNCNRFALYGTENRQWCRAHKGPNDFNVRETRYCHHKGCSKRAAYVISRDSKERWCKNHAPQNAINGNIRTCWVEGCEEKPTWGKIENKLPTSCVNHAGPKDVNFRIILCEEEYCLEKAQYGEHFGYINARRCKAHLLDSDIFCLARQCEIKGCEEKAKYGLEMGRHNAKRCEIHKKTQDIIVLYRTCEYPGCNHQPNFGQASGFDFALRCSKHKIEGDRYCMRTYCAHPDCLILPSFGFFDGKPKHCYKHRDDGEINLVNKKCEIDGCEITANYGPLDGIAKRCRSHIKPGDFHIYRLCKSKGCIIVASYGLNGRNAKHCGFHRKPDEINCFTPICKTEGCEDIAYYGPKGKSSLHCIDHKKEGEVSRGGKPCISCGLWYYGSYEKCRYCRPNEQRNGHEFNILSFLKSKKKFSGFTHDKMSADNVKACGRWRPDFVWDLGTHFVVLEVDEKQHKRYGEECERSRELDIACGLGLPTTFIRFNPDSYNYKGRRLNPPLEKRLPRLEKILDIAMRAKPSNFIYVKKVFYDL
jgi:hypothetical protein